MSIEQSVCWFCVHCIQRTITNSDDETGRNFSCRLTGDDLHYMIVHSCSDFELDREFLGRLNEIGEADGTDLHSDE